MVFPNSKAGCSRVPPQSATLMHQYCYQRNPVRLACLIHATSVRSEPESNSQKRKFLVLFTDLSHKHLLFHVSSEGSFLEPWRVTSQALIFQRSLRSYPHVLPCRANRCIVYHFLTLLCKGKLKLFYTFLDKWYFWRIFFTFSPPQSALFWTWLPS